MIVDNQLLLSDEQAITADAVSTNVIDMSAARRGSGNPLDVLLFVNETFDNLTSLTVTVQSCAVEGFGSGVVEHQTFVIAAADLTAGKMYNLGQLVNNLLQYVRLDYDVTGTNPAAGKVTALVAPYGGQTLPGQG